MDLVAQYLFVILSLFISGFFVLINVLQSIFVEMNWRFLFFKNETIFRCHSDAGFRSLNLKDRT